MDRTLVHPRNMISFLDGERIEIYVVNTESKGTLVFMCEDDWRCPLSLRGYYRAHLSNVYFILLELSIGGSRTIRG